jgi:high affinity Mn2+ porin
VRRAAVVGATLLALSAGVVRADEPRAEAPERLSLHYQATVAWQAHPSFSARYTGPNSLRPEAEGETSVVMTLFAGARLWKGAELYVNPELAGGRGLSSTLGVAAFPSGEVYRVGDPAPTIVLARLFLRQVIGLGGGRSDVAPGPNQLAGSQDRDTLTISAGKLSTTDLVDSNPFSSDPHSRFTSWGMWASAAYDYPADTHGYTWGVAADLSVADWSVRGGAFLEPTIANGLALEWDVSRAHGLVAEVERRWALGGRPGAARVLVFENTAHMGNYDVALAVSPTAPDVTATRAAARKKAGFAASANQDLGDGLGVFVRASWNDGANESWAFTEIDRSLAAGLVQSGARWRRPDDEAGIGAVVSGLSSSHRRYLAAGGLGFILGDGALNYGPEILGETYYRAAVSREISVVATYQPILHPAYNRDRGPAHVFTGRLHVAF